MRIAVIGASGWLGGTVAREALARGHEVTAIGRDETKLGDIQGAEMATADIGDPSSIARAVKGHDAVVSAVTDRTTDDRSIIPRTARTLLEVLPEAGVKRLVVVAQPDSSWAVSASASRRSRECVASPHHLVPGEKTGAYRVQAGDTPVIDESGDSRITAGDFAAALVDELENPRFVRQRFTAAY